MQRQKQPTALGLQSYSKRGEFSKILFALSFAMLF